MILRRALASAAWLVAAEVLGAQSPRRPETARETRGAARTVETEWRQQLLGGQSLDDAREDALRHCLDEAVRLVVGVEVRGATISTREETDGALVSGFRSIARANAYGRVVAHRVLRDSIETLQVPGVGPQRYLFLKVSADVVPESGNPDPGFTVHLELNAATFTVRDKGDDSDLIVATVTATRDAYLTLFEVRADSIEVIVPNRYASQNRAVAGVPFVFPTEAQRRSLGLDWSVSLPPGRRSSRDLVVVVATREPVPFPGVVMRRGADPTRTVPTVQATLEAFNRWLVNIPLGQRATAEAFFEVRRASASRP